MTHYNSCEVSVDFEQKRNVLFFDFGISLPLHNNYAEIPATEIIKNKHFLLMNFHARTGNVKVVIESHYFINVTYEYVLVNEDDETIVQRKEKVPY